MINQASLPNKDRRHISNIIGQCLNLYATSQ